MRAGSYRASGTIALGIVAAISGCTPIVPVNAAHDEIMSWSKDDVLACFGPAKDSDVVAGWPRYWFQRGDCQEWIMFDGDKVHAVQGYGAEQECWWVAKACKK
jgi:hypothetical protein